MSLRHAVLSGSRAYIYDLFSFVSLRPHRHHPSARCWFCRIMRLARRLIDILFSLTFISTAIMFTPLYCVTWFFLKHCWPQFKDILLNFVYLFFTCTYFSFKIDFFFIFSDLILLLVVNDIGEQTEIKELVSQKSLS